MTALLGTEERAPAALAPVQRHAHGVEAAVWAALDTVRDPELDEPLPALQFVASVVVEDGVASVHLRLPTYFCAPNFAFLMVADAYDAVSAVAGVDRAEVALDDHFASDVINRGVAARAGFVESFDGLAESELDQLRVDFVRKAVLAGTDRVCRPMLAGGETPESLAAMTIGDVPGSHELDRLRARRAEIGLPSGDGDPLLVDVVSGAAVGVEALPLHLRKARLTAVSLVANSGLCRGMLHARYAEGSITTGYRREEAR